MYKLDQISVRLVKDAPVFSEKPIKSPEDAVRVLSSAFGDYDREVMGVVHLKTDGTPINMTIASIGTLNNSLAHPRELLKAAFLTNAASIMLFHNHPSGDLTPSEDDILITDRMQKLCSLAGITLLDHVIIGTDGCYFSFREKAILPAEGIYCTSDLSCINLKVAEKGKEETV